MVSKRYYIFMKKAAEASMPSCLRRRMFDLVDKMNRQENFMKLCVQTTTLPHKGNRHGIPLS
jgi:ribosome-associated toxin RatA of RatAB toxin-antitoxin module